MPGSPSIASVDLLKHISESDVADERVRQRAKTDLERVTDAKKRNVAVQEAKSKLTSPAIQGHTWVSKC